MPSEASSLGLQAQTEKPQHYMYLKEFRTQQCPLFLQHKCTQHRPFTCFHWHFMNQRRRRPVRKRDGTFSYSPDIYCTRFDETTGLCPAGDECPYLHRTAGDTERRYHLRYYKTCTCVHETDARGHCTKNGPHCAFAHGAVDLRPPVYDVRELQVLQDMDTPTETVTSQLEKDRIANEDPKWNDTNYVLANYKTELCKRPPRLCRQGYACPSYHNSRDRRRSPKIFKYRSTPCPNVKHGDDWGDPTQCDSGDNCPYCHTRTEQQFHPEIYKSTKCNDMVQTGYCPRGPFCAFAHVEQEMNSQRDVANVADNSLAAFVSYALPADEKEGEENGKTNGNGVLGSDLATNESTSSTSSPLHTITTHDSSHFSINGNNNGIGSNNGKGCPSPVSLPDPIGKGRSNSLSNSIPNSMMPELNMAVGTPPLQRAPGSEREDIQSKLRLQIQAIEEDTTLDPSEQLRRKQNLYLLHNLSVSGTTVSLASTLCTTPSSMSPHAPSFYPVGDTVESVIGNALDEDLDITGLSLSLDRELGRDNDNDSNSVCSSLSTGFSSNSYLNATSVPVTIPSGGLPRGRLGSLTQSPCSSPFGSLQQNTMISYSNKEQQVQEAFLSQPNPGKFPAVASYGNEINSVSPHDSISQSPMLGSFGQACSNGYGELHRLRDELAANKLKLQHWEESIGQARNACEAWKKEAEESTRKARVVEEKAVTLQKQRDEAVNQVSQLTKKKKVPTATLR